MPQRDQTPFRIGCLAASIAALSACSSIPRDADDSLAGSVASAGARTWDRTLYLLGFEDEDPSARAPAPSELLDEVDLALLEEDAIMPEPVPRAADVVRSTAWSDLADRSIAVERTDADASFVDGRDSPAGGNELLADVTPLEEDAYGLDGGTGIGATPGAAPEAALDAAPGAAPDTAAAAPGIVAAQDLIHEVGPAETLWDIAKATTGDATNWRVLADVNELGPDAGLRPGQRIVVPADMVRPELAGRTIGTADAPVARTTAGTTAGEAMAKGTMAGETTVGGMPDGGMPDGGAGDDEAAVSALAASPPDGIEFDIRSGETLWDFAKRTTGDATHWRAIAAANGLSEEQATQVRPGQAILVPNALIRDSLTTTSATARSDDGGAVPAATATNAAVAVRGDDDRTRRTDTAAADAATRADAATIETGLAAVRTPDAEQPIEATAAGAALAGGGTAGRPIRVLESSYLTDTDAPRVSDAAAALGEPGDVPHEIMVSGTYYPKAVYDSADFSSGLLMRVSPGTTLTVSRAIGPWFEVQTDRGVGYMHARDIK